MTDADFLKWLKASVAFRVVLIEAVALIGGVETTIYMATGPYTTSPSDAPANTIYQPIASVNRLFTERLSLTGDGALSEGEVEIENGAGERDEWPGYVWANRPLKAFIGDVRWPRADFRPIFDGIVADIAPQGSDKLVLKLRDKLQRLNTPLSEAKLGGTGPNQDALLPLCFGECNNVSPLLIDGNVFKYRVHNGAVKSIFEIRDNGVPIYDARPEKNLTGAVVDNAAGTFTLAKKPVGVITCSVQGDMFNGVYSNTVTSIVRRIVTGYGKEVDRFTAADLDTANLDAFDAAHPQPVGLYVPERQNVLNACQQLAGSVGAQLSMSRLGLLRLLQVALPASGAAKAVRAQHMKIQTLQPVGREPVVAAVKLGFARNWTEQPVLSTRIPEEHKELFALIWLTTTKDDPDVLADYKLNAEPVQKDTMLLRRTDADVEAQRLLDLWKVPRTSYEFDGVPEMLELELGQAITVYYPRYGMKDGVSAMVSALSPDWMTSRIKVEFLV